MANQYTGLNGMIKMSLAEYSNMQSHDSNTKYTVVNGNSIEEYLGDVRITNTSGGSWVTMATFNAYVETQATIVEAIYNDVESLKTWKTNTVTPWISTMTTWKNETVDPFITSTEQSLSNIESALAGIDLSDLDGTDPTSWKSTVNSAISTLQSAVSSLQSAVSSLQSNAVTSSDIRIIDVVSEMPQSPVATTMYIVEGST